MTQTGWLAIIGGLYAALLVIATFGARRSTRDANDYMLAGSNLGAVMGCLTFGATLFSTFTLMGMPDFFRTHGVGAWIFLGVADAAVAFMVLWYAGHLRRRAARLDFRGIAGLMASTYGTKWAGYLYFSGVFLFLVPYVAVQIRGIGILLNAAYPDTLPTWGWSLAIVLTLLVYSEIGGLKAIVYSDAMQGLVTRYRLAGYPPDVLVGIPKDACRTLDFHKAGELIEIGRQRALEALEAFESASPQRSV